jgi:predicted acylesterase/phospholipase RssA
MRTRASSRRSTGSSRHPAADGTIRRRDIGLALAGGGPLGITYEIGALNALAESLTGVDFTRIGVHVGVSAGSAIAAGLANGIGPREMCRIFVEGESAADGLEPFDPSMLLQPAFGEYLRRLAAFPYTAQRALAAFWADPLDSGWGAAFARFGELVPTGIFDNSNVDRFLARLFAQPGRTNDFRGLHSTLLLVATDLDSGEAVPFGAPPFDRVPISRAVQASTALPLLYPPVTIGGRHYVDGALTKTMHASGAYHAGARLVFGVNPLVPYSAGHDLSGGHRHRALVPRGLPAVLSQTFRALIHSRMRATFAHYGNDFPGLDFILFEPEPTDADLFFTNIFSYASRGRLCEHAYQRTRAMLRARSTELAPILARHGLQLREDVLADETRTLVPVSKGRRRPAPGVVHELQANLAALTAWMGPDARAALEAALPDGRR